MKLFILFILALGLSGIDLYSQTKQKLTLNDVVNSRVFYAHTITGLKSMNDGDHYTAQEGNNILKYSYKTGLPVDTLLSSALLLKHGIVSIYSYEFDNSENRIIFSTNIKPIYRHSFLAEYYVYDMGAKQIIPVSENGKQQMATFSPDGNSVAFVRDNNIIISDLRSRTEYPVTTDGKKNEIINGMPDWVYEEEFALTQAFEWSPDGNSIAYLQFDEKNVKEFSIPIYDSLYPSTYTYKYPKAGEENSKVTVWVYNIDTKKAKMLDVGEADQYIPRIKWATQNNTLAIMRLNRLQNQVDILYANALNGQTKTVYSENNKYYISEIGDDYINFLPDGRFIIFSEADGYMHLYLHSSDGKRVKQLTSGKFDVTGFYGADPKSRLVYYSSTEVSPMDNDIYAVSYENGKKQKISTQKGSSEIEFSNNFKYYILTWSDANTPFKVSLHNANGKLLRVLEDNNVVTSRLSNYYKTDKEFMLIPTSDGILLNAYMIKPYDFDSTKQYPVLMYVYGGPESQEVTNKWSNSDSWLHMLAQMGYIVVCADNRGTDGRGEAFRKATYMQLGNLETIDQVNVARYISLLSYVDKNRIGIYGWSYGGYMAALCMTKGNGIFRVGISIAPVTNWRFYDTVYTERFMRTPQENPKGYDDNSPLNFAVNLSGKYLIIHGSADDNVHLQNTMMFTNRLVDANKSFDMAIYTNKNHGIYGGYTRLQLFRKIVGFISENL